MRWSRQLLTSRAQGGLVRPPHWTPRRRFRLLLVSVLVLGMTLGALWAMPLQAKQGLGRLAQQVDRNILTGLGIDHVQAEKPSSVAVVRASAPTPTITGRPRAAPTAMGSAAVRSAASQRQAAAARSDKVSGLPVMAASKPVEVMPSPVPPVELSRASMPYGPGLPEAVNIVLAAERVNGAVVMPGSEASFLALLGELSKRNGYVGGTALVGGEVVQTVGGGVCVVSTLVYRAAFAAGLEIVERRGHSQLLPMFDNPPGTDAAVFTPNGDLRWRNDTPSPVEVRASVEPEAKTVSISLWGQPDGRTTDVSQPTVKTVRRPPAVWTFDAKLPPDAVQKDSGGRGGAVTVVTRTVKLPDGHVLHQDRVVSNYVARPEEVRYGQEVVPPVDAKVVSTPPPTPVPPTVTPTAAPSRVPQAAPQSVPTMIPSVQPSDAPMSIPTPTPELVVPPTAIPTPELVVPPTAIPTPVPPAPEPTPEPASPPAEAAPTAEPEPIAPAEAAPTAEAAQQ